MPLMETLGSGIIGGGLGLIAGAINDDRQIAQQQKLTDQQIKAQKDLGKFNQGLALDTWLKTNYAAQREEMRKAGLNVGLMYGMAGGGGATTHGGSAGNVTTGTAPNPGGEIMHGMAMGLQGQLMMAQKENIEANTEKTKADTAKTTGVDTQKTGAEVTNLQQITQNAQVQNQIMQYERDIKQLEATIKDQTKEETIAQISKINDKLYGEAKSAMAKGSIDENTTNTLIQQIQQNAVEQGLRIAGQQAGLIKIGADTAAVKQATQKMATEIVNMTQANAREWAKLSIDQKELIIKQALQANQTAQTTFNTSTPAVIRQWIGILDGILPSIEVLGKIK